MNIKIVFLVVICLLVGFVAGKAQTSSDTPKPPELEAARPNFENLQEIADIDIQEYYRLKTEEEKFKKADEIFGKIIQIFLADLGMKVAMPKEALAGSQVAISAAQPKTEESVAAQNPKIKPEAQPQVLRQPLTDLRTHNDINEFVKASTIENFEDAVKTSSGFTNKAGNLENFSGHYSGSAQVDQKGATERWDIEMRLRGKIVNGQLVGKRSLKLSKNGRVFSDSSGDGPLDEAYREIPNDPEAVIIAAGPSTFLQAYQVPSTGQIVGHVMHKNSVRDSYKSIGSFELNRR